MLTGLADLTLFHFEPHVTPHLRPISSEFQLGEHTLDPCVSLLVSVPN